MNFIITLKKITITQIKQGLGKLFSPRHVARLGNNHIIIPTLSEASFSQHINQKLNEIKEYALKNLKIDLKFSKEFIKRIYSEAVVPAQGVRPISGTIDRFAQDPLPDIHSFIESKYKKHPGLIKLSVSLAPLSDKSIWTFESGKFKGKTLQFLIPDDSISVYKNIPKQLKAVNSVRLAAQVTVILKLEKWVPEKIFLRSRVDPGKTYIQSGKPFYGNEILFREQVVEEIIKNVTGFVSERSVFEQVTLQSTHELNHATQLASDMVHYSGMGNKKNPSIISSNEQVMRAGEIILSEVDQILEDAKKSAQHILEKEKEFYLALLNQLQYQNVIEEKEIANLILSHWSDSEEAKIIISGNSSDSACIKKVAAILEDPKLLKFITSTKGKLGYTGKHY